MDAANRTVLIAGLHAALVSAGWSFVPLADGYKYTITSPQGLVAKVTLRDTGRVVGLAPSYPAVDVRFMSEDESLQGPVHALRTQAGHIYQVIVNTCQLWVSWPEHTTGLATMACGGIPFVPIAFPGECGTNRGSDLITTDIWWSNGNLSPLNFWTESGRSFRRSYCVQLPATYSACRNGDLLTSYGDQSGMVRLLPLAQQGFFPTGLGTGPPTRLLVEEPPEGLPLWIDPMLMWGSLAEQGQSGQSPARIKGQVWDAAFRTASMPIDDVYSEIIGGGTAEWMNFMAEAGVWGTYLGCLYLLRTPVTGGGPSGPLNYVY